MSTIINRDHIAPSASAPPAVPAHIRQTTPLWRRALRAVPAATVVVLLVGVAVWGHSTDWRVPKFSTLMGKAATHRKDWCEEHGVPESQCVECNPDLLPKGVDYGWCQVHGVHNCPLCHPDVAQAKEILVVSEVDRQRAQQALALQPRTANNSACKFYQRRIQFASLEAVKKAGVDVDLVERQPVRESIAGNGEITYDQSRFANLSSRVAGTIWRVEKNIGDRVRAGEVLAVIDAMPVGQAKGELVDAMVQETLDQKTFDRLRKLGDGVVAARQVLEAEASFRKAQLRVLAAQQALANLGLTVDLNAIKALSGEAQIAALRVLGLEDIIPPTERAALKTANLLAVRSPMDGIVVNRKVVAGEVVDTSNVLFEVADTSRMWVKLNVPLEEATKLSLGLPVRFRPDGSQMDIAGALSWISTAVDSKTRMIDVRAEIPNPNGQLRAETFGSGQIILREEPEAIVVPTEAVHWEGCCHVVFVRNKHFFDSPASPKVFQVRSVRVGSTNGKFTEIIAGVLPGEVVATKGSDVLRSQLLKNNLGEGCTCGQ